MKLRQLISKYRLHHLMAWLTLGLAWYYLRYQDYSTNAKAIWVTVTKTLDLALMVYLANYILIPRLLYRKKHLWFIMSVILMVAVSSIFKMFLIGKITEDETMMAWSGNVKGKIYDNVIPHLFLVIAGMAFKLLLDYGRVQKRLMEVAKERAEAELDFLKSQINPHFLFNSLNSVYFLIDKNNTRARQALHQFSEMLRYQLYETTDAKIPIEKEIVYLEDYINLQRLRVDENYSVQLSIQRDMKSFLIEPLLLIPFVENSFKHLSHYGNGQPNEIKIDLSEQDDEMKFAISNTTEGKTKAVQSSSGIGLANVKRRLELLYPQKHHLEISEENGWFGVKLKIKTAYNCSL